MFHPPKCEKQQHRASSENCEAIDQHFFSPDWIFGNNRHLEWLQEQIPICPLETFVSNQDQNYKTESQHAGSIGAASENREKDSVVAFSKTYL